MIDRLDPNIINDQSNIKHITFFSLRIHSAVIYSEYLIYYSVYVVSLVYVFVSKLRYTQLLPLFKTYK